MATCAAVLALAGCMSNQPTTLNALSAGTPQEAAAAILNHPLYEKADKF